MKGIYLASFKAYHKDYNIVYQDINNQRDLNGCMLSIDLKDYDFIIATPPCNYYSRANYRREQSLYSQKTKHLLPQILKKLRDLKKPYIVENVINYPLMKDFYDNDFVYQIGRHTYWTNIPFNFNKKQKTENIQLLSFKDRQGSENVHEVIEYWLKQII